MLLRGHPQRHPVAYCGSSMLHRTAGGIALSRSVRADGMGAVGLITAVGLFEVFYNSGFSIAWWQQLQPAILMFVAF